MGDVCLDSPNTAHVEPHAITRAQLTDLLDGLGLGRDLAAVKSIHLEWPGATVVRFRRNADGHFYSTGSDPATVTTKIALVG